MGKRKRDPFLERKRENKRREPSYWIIIAVIGFVFVMGLGIKIAFFPDQSSTTITAIGETPSRADEDLEGKALLVASEFRCACGRCGELRLIECDCDMPQGAQEEKHFIRAALKKGLSVSQVTQLVEKRYGHRS
ncbi:MAG: hypothetical protein V1689_01770 [Pseudomonadota bacterium]